MSNANRQRNNETGTPKKKEGTTEDPGDVIVGLHLDEKKKEEVARKEQHEKRSTALKGGWGKGKKGDHLEAGWK